MKKFKWIAAILSLMLMGCQLAEETKQNAPDQMNEIIGFMVVSQDQMNGAARYDASCDRDTNGDYLCSFDGLDGYLTILTYPIDDEGYSYRFKDENMSALIGKTNLNVNETATISAERTLNIIAENRETDILFNIMPIYFNQGEIYLSTETPGIGFARDHVGYQASQSLTYDVNISGKVEKIDITVHFNTMYQPEKHFIYYMNNDNQVIESSNYEPENIDDEINVPSETAYMIIETQSRDFDGQLISNRQIIDRDSEAMTTYYAYDDTVCNPKITTLNWK